MKHKSLRNGPYFVHKVHSNGVIEIINPKSENVFKINGHQLKSCFKPMVQEKEELFLIDPFMAWEKKFRGG